MSYSKAANWVNGLTDTLVVSMLNWIFSMRVREHVYYKCGLYPREFNWLFFCSVVSKCLEEFFDYSMIDALPNYQLVSATNYPNFSQDPWRESEFVQSGFAEVFTETIRRESSVDGPPFDVTFACEFVAYVIDNNQDDRIKISTLEYLKNAKGKMTKSFSQQLDDGDDIWG